MLKRIWNAFLHFLGVKNSNHAAQETISTARADDQISYDSGNVGTRRQASTPESPSNGGFGYSNAKPERQDLSYPSATSPSLFPFPFSDTGAPSQVSETASVKEASPFGMRSTLITPEKIEPVKADPEILDQPEATQTASDIDSVVVEAPSASESIDSTSYDPSPGE